MSLTPTQVQTTATDLYNATGDTFFSSTQMNIWMTEACNILAKEANLIERIFTTTTVAGQQDYLYPANTIEIKRVTYNGKKLKRITHRQDDAVTLSNQNSTTMGNVVYYTDWNFTISCRPIPDSAFTLAIYSYNLAQDIQPTSTLEIPSIFQFGLVYYLCMQMASKDQNWNAVQYYDGKWKEVVTEAVRWKKRQKRGDSFATVQDEETLPVTILGEA